MRARIVKDTITPRLVASGGAFGRAPRRVVEVWLGYVRDDAAKNAPRDLGDLAGSLHVEVGAGDPPKSGGIYSDSRKFYYVHGAVKSPAVQGRRTRPHWPPANQSLRGWAKR